MQSAHFFQKIDKKAVFFGANYYTDWSAIFYELEINPESAPTKLDRHHIYSQFCQLLPNPLSNSAVVRENLEVWVNSNHPLPIAELILCIAICLQNLAGEEVKQKLIIAEPSDKYWQLLCDYKNPERADLAMQIAIGYVIAILGTEEKVKLLSSKLRTGISNYLSETKELTETSLLVFIAPEIVLEDDVISWSSGNSLSIPPQLKNWLETLQTVGIEQSVLNEPPDNLKVAGDINLMGAWLTLKQHLRLQGSLRYVLRQGTVPISMLVPFNERWSMNKLPEDTQIVQLSRFALLRREENNAVLESSRGHGRIVIYHQAVVSLLIQLIKPRSLFDLLQNSRETLTLDTLKNLLEVIHSINALTVVEAEKPVEDTQPFLAQWSFHDLLFHSRSRLGRYSGFLGCLTVPAANRSKLPAVPPSPEGQVIPLDKPELHLDRGRTFTDVLESRQTSRLHGERPLLLSEVSEFLYRSARVRKIIGRGSQNESTPSFTFSNRTYPSSGATYELDLFLAITDCDGLASGFYYYDPYRHHLIHLSKRTVFFERLLQDARKSTTNDSEPDRLFPQMLIVYAPRFARIMWQYERVAYALLLKNVGSLHQTMYLVAEAMGLAGCALSNGNADLFRDLYDVPYEFQSSVGEFALNSRSTSTNILPAKEREWWERALYHEAAQDK